MNFQTLYIQGNNTALHGPQYDANRILVDPVVLVIWLGTPNAVIILVFSPKCRYGHSKPKQSVIVLDYHM